MSNAGIIIITLAFWGAVIYFAVKILARPVKSMAGAVADGTKSVTARAGHGLQLVALRAETGKLVKVGLEVSDQHTGANELGLDSSLTKKNEALAKSIAERAFSRLGSHLSGPLPPASVLGAYALYEVASHLSERQLREKTRIAGSAVMELVKRESHSSLSSPLSRELLSEIASISSTLDTEDILLPQA